MLQAAQIASISFVGSRATKTRADDASFAVVLAVCAVGFALSLVATAITPDWVFALAM
jgi:dipeptide/tripeptide permease